MKSVKCAVCKLVNWGDKANCLRCGRHLSARTIVRRDDGLAWASLMLGLGGFLLFGLSSLIGLVLGFVALRRIRRNPATHGGRSYALAGIAVSCLSLLLLSGLAVFLARTPELTQQAQSELKSVMSRPASKR